MKDAATVAVVALAEAAVWVAAATAASVVAVTMPDAAAHVQA